ncbi:hypothetical protein ABZP36_020343 [Zizania latifolia]
MTAVEADSHGCDCWEMADAVKSKWRYGDHTGFVSPTTCAAVGPYEPFYVAGAARESGVVFDDVVAEAPAPQVASTKGARAGDRFFGAASMRERRAAFDVRPPVVPQCVSPLFFPQEELEQCWRRYVMQELTEEKRLAVAKDEEEVERTRSLNRILQTEMRAMNEELTVWRGLATALRGDLERALQPRWARVDDESSCCYRQNGDAAESCGDNGVLLGSSEEELGSADSHVAGRVPEP